MRCTLRSSCSSPARVEDHEQPPLAHGLHMLGLRRRIYAPLKRRVEAIRAGPGHPVDHDEVRLGRCSPRRPRARVAPARGGGPCCIRTDHPPFELTHLVPRPLGHRPVVLVVRLLLFMSLPRGSVVDAHTQAGFGLQARVRQGALEHDDQRR
jgi:hypothetical protein